MSMMASFTLLTILAVLGIGRTGSVMSPVVHTIWGDIEGINDQDDKGNHLEKYLGIPFAEPPVGDLRFKKPVPHPGYRETYNASKLGPACLQVVYGFGPVTEAFGEEDCLTLNVYVPLTNKTSSPRAVMVWIYGGGFIVGDTHWYDPSPLATVGNVIAVTIQYRLGPFGFLSTMDNAAKGNYGLWDQLLALKWIKKNIAAFGGDPEQISIIGESAGAASVGFLTISPEAKGLFKRAILQSGSVTSPWAINKNSLSVVNHIAKQVGCNAKTNDHSALVSCLRNIPARNLTFASGPMVSSYAPVVDGIFILDDPRILLSSPQRLLSSAFSSCDVMIGVNNNEGAGIYFNTSEVDAVRKSRNYKTELLPKLFKDFYGDYTTDMIETAVFEYMFPTPVNSDMFDLQPIFDTKTDASFLVPGVQFARAHASSKDTGRTYFYYFNHNPQITFPPEESWSHGMHHAYDLYYTFGFNDGIVKAMATGSNISSAEVSLSLTFRNILTDFAKSGDPNAAVKDLTSETWSEFDRTTEKFLEFNDHMTVRSHVEQRRVSLWLDLLPRLQTVHKYQAGTVPVIFPQFLG